MGVSFDPRKAHLTQLKGDIEVMLTWIDDTRALLMRPAFRLVMTGAIFVVMEPVAHEWNDQDRDNFTPQLTKSQRRKLKYLPRDVQKAFLTELAHSGLGVRAAKACMVLGIEPSQANCFRIIGIVNSMLPELARMPSAPPPEYLPGVYGHSILSADGAPIAHEDIRVERHAPSYAPTR